MITRKKISLERFNEKSGQVLKLVSARGMEVIVYDAGGPVALLSPLAMKKTARSLRLIDSGVKGGVRQMDLGGIWKMPEAVIKRPQPPRRVSRLRGIISGGLLKAARASAILPVIAKFPGAMR